MLGKLENFNERGGRHTSRVTEAISSEIDELNY